MKGHEKGFVFFAKTIWLCIVLSIILSSLLFLSVKRDITHDFKALEFTIDSEVDFDSELYYSYSDEFDASLKIANTGLAKNTSVFLFPKRDKMITKFRLDFGDESKSNKIKLKELRIIFKDRTIVLDEEKAFSAIFLNSGAVVLDKNKRIIYTKMVAEPFDPYIVFAPLGKLTVPTWKLTIALLFPFLLLLAYYSFKNGLNMKISWTDFLGVLFIVSIPLKIAWTTFCAILWAAYGVGFSIKKRENWTPNKVSYFFMVLFLILFLFGRPNSLSIIDKYFVLLLFAIINTTIAIPKIKLYRFYIIFFMFFNAVIVAAGINFFIWFNDFYGMTFLRYFSEIKTYSGNIREWLYYDHAAFLSFFGVIGLLFLHELYERLPLDKRFVYTYHGLLLLFIIFVGARLCLILYVVVLINLILKWNIKKRIVINALLYIIVSTFTFFYIQKLDFYRHHLWSVSWQAIKERPIFGYGLGKSNEILQNQKNFEVSAYSTYAELNHSHNQFLTFMLELGILGFGALIVAALYFFLRTQLWREKYLIIFVFGLLYIFLTESILETSKPLYVICFLFLLLLTKSETVENKVAL